MTDATHLNRTLGLRSLVLFGLAYLTPMIVLGIFGVIASASDGASASAYLIALFAMADSTGGRNEFRELLRWCQISERLAWSAVERVLNRGQVRAANDAQIGALRKVLT